MRKILSVFLCIVLSFCFSAVTIAADLSPVNMYGNIVSETESRITVESETGDSVVLNLSDATFIIDAITGEPASIDKRSSDRVAVYYGPVTTRSIPPQSNAVAVIVNLPEKKYSPHYAVVEKIERDGDKIKVLTNGGSVYVTIMRDTPISPYRTLNIITIDDINIGTELMLWYDMVALSYPSQATSLKTVVLKSALSDDVTLLPDNEVSGSDRIILVPEAGVASVNGTEVDLKDIIYKNDGTMILPLRQLCEALGFEVNWMQNTGTVEITRGEISVELESGNMTYRINGAEITLDFAPEVENGITFVPPAFFESVLGVEFITNNQNI